MSAENMMFLAQQSNTPFPTVLEWGVSRIKRYYDIALALHHKMNQPED